MDTWRVRTHYIDARTMQNADKARPQIGVELPDGWEPIGGDIETGGALRLVLARRMSEAEQVARFKARVLRPERRMTDEFK